VVGIGTEGSSSEALERVDDVYGGETPAPDEARF
jgi:hypothetical protein